jgi:hypothetical protein
MKKFIISIILLASLSLIADDSFCLVYALYMKGPGHYLERESRCSQILEDSAPIPYRNED